VPELADASVAQPRAAPSFECADEARIVGLLDQSLALSLSAFPLALFLA
jgi:hypothetical protein